MPKTAPGQETHDGVNGPKGNWICTQSVDKKSSSKNFHLPFEFVKSDDVRNKRQQMYDEIKSNWHGEVFSVWFPQKYQPDDMPQTPLDWSGLFLTAFKDLSDVTKHNMEHAHHHLDLISKKVTGGKLCSKDVVKAAKARMEEKYVRIGRTEKEQRIFLETIEKISKLWPDRDSKTWFPERLRPDGFPSDVQGWEQEYATEFAELASVTRQKMRTAHKYLDSAAELSTTGKLDARGIHKAYNLRRLYLDSLEKKDEKLQERSKPRPKPSADGSAPRSHPQFADPPMNRSALYLRNAESSKDGKSTKRKADEMEDDEDPFTQEPHKSLRMGRDRDRRRPDLDSTRSV